MTFGQPILKALRILNKYNRRETAEHYNRVYHPADSPTLLHFTKDIKSKREKRLNIMSESGSFGQVSPVALGQQCSTFLAKSIFLLLQLLTRTNCTLRFQWTCSRIPQLISNFDTPQNILNNNSFGVIVIVHTCISQILIHIHMSD